MYCFEVGVVWLKGVYCLGEGVVGLFVEVGGEFFVLVV